jgi:hypothetical protein
VRTRRRSLRRCLATVCLIAAAVVSTAVIVGCGGSSAPQSTAPKDTSVNPGPNTTTVDPGPNDTANGPQTLQGRLVARASCLELDGNVAEKPKARFEITFRAETVKHQGANLVLTGADGDHTIGPHDIVYLAGHPGTGSGKCGQRFEVDKVVAVTPAP